MNIFRTMIVAAEHVDLARRLCAELAGQPGDGMFVTPLYDATGDITHYVSSGAISADFAGALSNPSILYGACRAHVPPVTVTLAECSAMLASSIVAEGDPRDLFAGHDLTLTAPETAL